MSTQRHLPEESGCDYWAVCKAAGNFSNQASTLAARHIKDGTLRLQFNREVAYYARDIVNDVARGNKSPEQGLEAIKAEQNVLLNQSWEITQKGIGVIAGAFQVVTGAGICYGSAGTLCVFLGAPLMLHGTNNMYENGRDLLERRSGTQGPVRRFYHSMAELRNGGELEGNMAYGAMDLTLSIYSVSRMVLKPDAWRLFRYVKTDYVRAYKTTGQNALIFEGISNSLTGRSMYMEYVSDE